jgi:hypothetical protein
MMINKWKFAFMVAVALSSMASPAFARVARTAPHRRVYNFAPDRPAYGANDYAPDPGVASPSDPVNNPAMSGGGSMGYNKYMGHAH